MEEGRGYLQEMKRLSKKHLVLSNIGMILLFALFWFFAAGGVSATVILGIACAVLWVFVGNVSYTILTGKVIGTKTMQRLQTFKIERHGKKKWRIKATIILAFFLAIAIGSTVWLFVYDTGTGRLYFPEDSFGFIGAWLGMNIGEIHRIRKLSKEISQNQQHHASESF